jgi:ribonucleoside-diphosphate reductase alpha chain
MRIERRYTKADQSPYAGIDFRLTTSEIRNPDGSVVFRLENVEVPEFWSQVASDVLAQKYFRKAGVAARLKKVEEETVPSWLWRSVPDEALALLPEIERIGGEPPPSRCSTASPAAGPTGAGRAATSPRRRRPRLLDELRFMLATQMVAPNSPQWFNTGLHWAYGIDGPARATLRRPLHRQADQVQVGL